MVDGFSRIFDSGAFRDSGELGERRWGAPSGACVDATMRERRDELEKRAVGLVRERSEHEPRPSRIEIIETSARTSARAPSML